MESILEENKKIQEKVGRKYIFLSQFKKWAWILIGLFSILQLLFFWSTENFFSIGCIIFTWAFTDSYILKIGLLKKFPFSCLIILGYSITQYLLPLIFTFLEGKPVIYNLNLPYTVFFHSLLSFFVLLLVHIVYVTLRRTYHSHLFMSIQNKLVSVGIFHTHSTLQIWLMGFIGIVGMTVKYLHTGSSEQSGSNTDSLSKFVEGFVIFSYAPIFIPLRTLFKSDRENTKSVSSFLVIGYMVIILLLGIASNSRYVFMVAVTSFAISYFIGLLLNIYSSSIINFKNTLFAILGIWLLTGPIVDLGTAMVIVRAQRHQTSSIDLFKQTIDVYKDDYKIDKFRKLTKLRSEIWDEDYFDNILMARFANLKFNDLSLEHANKLNGIDTRMQDASFDKFVSVFPSPILNLLQIDVDKQSASSSSFGDFLFYSVTGGGLNNFKLGHFSGTGMATFGWWYLAILGFAMVPIFFLVDLLVICRLKYSASKYNGNLFSLAGLISITSVFTFLSLSPTSESVIYLLTYILRDWIQTIVLYWFVWKVTIIVSRSFISVQRASMRLSEK